ncbi:MAG: thiamine phosphate synthase [Gemmatimonadales bacterium]
MRPPLPRLHAITDEHVARRPALESAARALVGGAGPDLALHARGRTLSGLEHYRLALRLTIDPAIRLFVNDRLDVALAVQASGVQLPRGSLPPSAARRLDDRWWIGCSVHSLGEARSALDEGADYLLVGPVYPTATHPGVSPLGLGPLREIVGLGIPVIAIGGVTPQRAAELRRTGAHGVAALRALWDAADPSAAAREMMLAMDHT